MPKVSKDHVEARREQILDGARRCFARWGYEGATVPRLEREIGLSHGAIFNYYRSKLDLFYELARGDHARFERIWEQEGFEALAEAIAREDPDWLGVYLEFHRLLRTNAALRRRWRSRRGEESEEDQWLEREREAGRIRSDVPDTAIFAFLHTLLDGLVMARTAGTELDVKPIVELALESIAPR